MTETLLHSQAEIVRQLMIDLALGTSASAWPVYFSNEPATPDDCLTVYNKVGVQHGRTHDDGVTQEHHGIQVRVRAMLHVDGYIKAKAVVDAFDQSVNNTLVTITDNTSRITDYIIHAITRQNDVFSLGYESPTSRRRLFTVNAVVSIRLLSTIGT